MKNQRFTVFTQGGESHIYLKPNMPEPMVNEELNKKFGKQQWLYTDYNTNQIFNPMAKHKLGGFTDSLKKATVSFRKGVGKSVDNAYDLTKPKVVKAAKSVRSTIFPAVKATGKTVFSATKEAGKYIWDALEEVAPSIFDASKRAGKRLAKETADFTTDVTNYGLTKAEQYQKYKLLQTAQAKKEFNDIMRKFKAGLLKKNGVEVTEFRKALKMAVEKSFDTDEKMLRSLAKGERGMIVFDKFDIPNHQAYEYAKMIKDQYPKIWAIGGNIFGNTAFQNLERVVKRGYWLDSEEPMYKKWKAASARYAKNKRLEGKITLLKWMSWGDSGRGNTELLIDNAIAKLYHHQYGKGGKIIDLKPLSEIPLSTQLQRHTGDSYNVHNFRNESGEGLNASPGNVIVHIDTEKKFRIPLENLKQNGLGGFTYPGDQEQIAKSVDLITLPKNVEGTNCGNCMFAKPMNKSEGIFMCNNPKINLVVTDRMCCALWDNKDAIRQWVKYENGGEVSCDPFEEKLTWEKNQKWIAATLANDETSSDEELVNYFVKEGLSETEAKHYVSQRDRFLKGACPCSLKKYEEGGDVLHGGLGDNIPDSAFDPEKLKRGIKVEMEHTDDPEIAKEITKDHYTEFPPTPTKDYYEELELMEEKLKEPDPINISDEDAEFPSNDQAQARMESIPDGDKFYLYGKDVSGWSEADLQNYINFIRNHAKDQYQAKYEMVNDHDSSQEFVDFVQNTKNDLVHDDLIIIALMPCQSFTKVTRVLAKTGYLIPSNKYASGGITVREIGSNKHKLTKTYELTGNYNGEKYRSEFYVYFVPETQPEVSRSSKYKFNYKPVDAEIETVGNSERKYLPISKIDPELLEEIKKDIEHFRITKADASEWKTYKKGGDVPRYTFEEQKRIGAEILRQIGRDTLMNIGAHNYGVGENDKGFPYIQFKASGQAHKRGLYITVYYNPLDWYIVEGVTVINFNRKEVAKYDMVYNDQLSEIVNQIVNGKKYNKGGKVLDNYRAELDAMTDEQLEQEIYEQKGIEVLVGEDDRDDYIDDLVSNYKQVLKSRGEKFEAGGKTRGAVGGLTVGLSHKEGGIPLTVKSTGQKIEVEGGELIVNKKNIASKKKYIITKPLTPKQIGSCINELDGNGVKVRDENSPCPIVEVDKNATE